MPPPPPDWGCPPPPADDRARTFVDPGARDDPPARGASKKASSTKSPTKSAKPEAGSLREAVRGFKKRERDLLAQLECALVTMASKISHIESKLEGQG